MQSVKDAANYVSESVQGAGAEASKTANKETAKDSNASMSTRASAGMDALGDKKDESAHNAKADVNKESAKH
ncbi:glucose-repressible protein Grg1 [Calycina marina]|uniref:Glucose-repressible protein Grg1 n=1 Tax=Calycina marina TaxID=1763456 RepID=A0A9P7Z6K6_9HELO|nr:glucose-repressible protein Grg1 [Calycina marina]